MSKEEDEAVVYAWVLVLLRLLLDGNRFTEIPEVLRGATTLKR